MKLIRYIFITLFTVFLSYTCNAQRYSSPTTSVDVSIDYIVKTINSLRAKGCRCGSKKYQPAPPVTWHTKLEQSAYNYAKEMYTYENFSHIGIDGSQIGNRLDRVDYYWRLAGENIGEGQKYYKEALQDWILSPSHCKLLMNPEMTNLGLGRYGKYWALHMATPMPPNQKRGNIRYK